MTLREKRLLAMVKALHLAIKRLENGLKNHDENLMAHIPLQELLEGDLSRHVQKNHEVNDNENN